MPKTATQEEVEQKVKELNDDPKVHGILVQLPLPSGLDEEKCCMQSVLKKTWMDFIR